MDNSIRIGAMISGGGTNLQAIIDACESKRITGKMVFVGSDNPTAAGLQRAARHGIPTFVVDYTAIIRQYKAKPNPDSLPADFDYDEIQAKQSFFDSKSEKAEMFIKTRAIAEAGLLAQMKNHSFDLVVLAGFMRNLTPYFIDRVNTNPDRPRIMNIHPALLPAFPGVDGYGDTFRYGCKVGGCTVHFIDYGEDSGPIIGQKAFEIESEDTIDSIRKKGLGLEWELFPECIQLFAEGRLQTVKMSYPLPNKRTVRRTVVKIR